MTTYEPVANVEVQRAHPAQRALLQLTRGVAYLVYLYVLFVEIILFLGFFLLLAGANPSSSFVQWLYRSLDRTMEPFRGIFTPIQLGTTTGNQVESVFETSVLFAMIVYGIIAIAVSGFVNWMSHRVERLDREDLENQQRQIRERAAMAFEANMSQGVGPAPAAQPAGAPTPRPQSGPPGDPTPSAR